MYAHAQHLWDSTCRPKEMLLKHIVKPKMIKITQRLLFVPFSFSLSLVTRILVSEQSFKTWTVSSVDHKLRMHVSDAPQCVHPGTVSVAVQTPGVNSSSLIRCDTQAVPAPSSFRWSVNTSSTISNILNQNTSLLTLTTKHIRWILIIGKWSFRIKMFE